ncbi:uncharacterized protein BKA78DRAFT_364461 [Phyllosticta capitalensis]|uniref:uncharacterized protein n=1 Tax=Phyllosticta capitalensis TaxID=121624 RepID=UPI00312F322C
MLRCRCERSDLSKFSCRFREQSWSYDARLGLQLSRGRRRALCWAGAPTTLTNHAWLDVANTPLLPSLSLSPQLHRSTASLAAANYLTRRLCKTPAPLLQEFIKFNNNQSAIQAATFTLQDDVKKLQTTIDNLPIHRPDDAEEVDSGAAESEISAGEVNEHHDTIDGFPNAADLEPGHLDDQYEDQDDDDTYEPADNFPSGIPATPIRELSMSSAEVGLNNLINAKRAKSVVPSSAAEAGSASSKKRKHANIAKEPVKKVKKSKTTRESDGTFNYEQHDSKVRIQHNETKSAWIHYESPGKVNLAAFSKFLPKGGEFDTFLKDFVADIKNKSGKANSTAAYCSWMDFGSILKNLNDMGEYVPIEIVHTVRHVREHFNSQLPDIMKGRQ